MSTPENPPAFPEIETNSEIGKASVPFSHVYSYGGMTLRDYFAAKAMQSIVVNIGDIMLGGNSEDVAKSAYGMADAMLKERAKQ